MAKLKKGKTTQIRIVKTQGEWDMIIKKIVPHNNQGQCLLHLSIYIRRKVLKIKNLLEEIPEDSVLWMAGDKLTKRPYIDNEIMADIKLIATKTKLTETEVIDRLIITPLLQPQP